MGKTTVLEIRRTFSASPERVFEAFRDPEKVGRWAAPSEHHNERVEQDFRVGGRYRREMRFPDGSLHVLSGIYKVIDPPTRLVYTYRWETLPLPETVVEIELEECADGTELRVLQRGFPGEAELGGHETGWSECFDGLDELLAGPPA